MNLKFPQMSEDEQAALHVARVKLESEND
jgi:hypothetical protein